MDGELIASGEALLAELQEEKRERELQERLAREKAEREAAAEELGNAVSAAKESRDAGGLTKPIKRAKKAVDFPAEELGAAEALKACLAQMLLYYTRALDAAKKGSIEVGSDAPTLPLIMHEIKQVEREGGTK